MSFDLGTTLKSLLKFDFGKKQTGPVIGVDVGASALKLVQLHEEEGVPTLDTYGELQLGPYADLDIGRTVSLPTERLIEAFVDIIRESSITGSTAALSISYASSFTTTITINAIDEEEIARQVPIEAKKYIPVSLNEVTLDWFPLATDKAANRTQLFLVAIHNEAFNQLRSVLANAGFALSYTELEPFSAARAVLSEQNKTSAIIDLGASGTKIYLVHGGTMQKTHSTPLGGSTLTETIQNALAIPFAKAEEQKRAVGLQDSAGGDAVAQVLAKTLERPMRELGKVIDDHERQSGIQFPTVLLLGGGASMPGIVGYVQDKLQRPVSRALPFNKIAYPAFLEDALKDAGPSFSVAVGSALRHFNS